MSFYNQKRFHSLPPAKLSPRSIQTATLSTSSCSFAFGSILKPHNSGALSMDVPKNFHKLPGPHNPHFKRDTHGMIGKQSEMDVKESFQEDTVTSDTDTSSSSSSNSSSSSSSSSSSPSSFTTDVHSSSSDTSKTMPGDLPVIMNATKKDCPRFENGPWVVQDDKICLPNDLVFEDGTPARYRPPYQIKQMDAPSAAHEKLLPYRFQYPELFSYDKREVVNMCYTTSSGEYGGRRPSIIEISNKYNGLSTQFTNTFKSGVFKQAGLNCSMMKSKVMAPGSFSKM